jgi:hypothetical protein
LRKIKKISIVKVSLESKQAALLALSKKYPI